MRLNYLLWVEDLLNLNDIKEVNGVDIGTGATCIFALLGAKKFSWNITATETDDKSIVSAQGNINRNSLQNKISVRTTTESKILVGVIKNDEDFHFCICNPPFFGDERELSSESKARTDHRTSPGNVQTGSHHELITPGGEVQFVSRIIQDSCVLRDKIRIYTSMVGHKKHVDRLVGEIKKIGASCYTQTTFFQGKTMRWGIAWSFDPNIQLLPDETKSKIPKEAPPYSVELPPAPEETIETLKTKLFKILENLEISVTSQENSDDAFCLDAAAYKNTWCRKYRRQMMHKDETEGLESGKRKRDEDQGPAAKRPKSESESVLVRFTLGLLYLSEGSHLELTYIDGSGGREVAFNLLKHIYKEMTSKGSE